MLRSALPALLLATPLAAEVPVTVTDIAPVQGLVASVMGDLGSPGVLVPQGASPHDHALAPSEARSLQNAGLVFWIGPDLSPDIGRKIGTIASGATVVTLADLPVTQHLATRDEVIFEAGDDDHDDHDHDHDHAEHDHDDHDHDEHGHDDHDHDGHDHDGHDDDHAEDAHGHHHGPEDPHVWLSPDNAAAWLDVIAEALSEADPENAATYAANAETARAELDAAVAQARETLAPAQDARYVVFHDGYQYFEAAFGLKVLGAIKLSDATDPSPAHLLALREAVAKTGAACIFAEPQFNPRLIDSVTEGNEVAVAELDPLGSTLEPGPGFYPAFITDLADRIAGCTGR